MSDSDSRLPSMTALRVLLAVAERGSTTAAAEATHLSQSAVSKQLLALEKLIGRPAFTRTARGMVPTDAGRIYIQQAKIAVKAMEDAALRLARLRPDPKVLRLQVLPIFGDRWLLPRFAEFSERHPDIDIQFTTFVSPSQREAPDGVFRFCEGLDADEEGFYLCGRDVRLVSAPAYWAKQGRPSTFGDLNDGVVLEHPQTELHWAHFAAANGLGGATPRHTVRFGYYTMVIRAALAGQGMALIPRDLIIDELADGRLENPLDLGYRSALGYWFAMAAESRGSPALVTFVDWLRAQCAPRP